MTDILDYFDSTQNIELQTVKLPDLALPIYTLESYKELKRNFMTDNIGVVLEDSHIPDFHIPQPGRHFQTDLIKYIIPNEPDGPYCNTYNTRWNEAEVEPAKNIIERSDVTIMDVIYANPELNPTLSGYEKVCTTNAKFKTLGEATGRATIEGVEYMLSQPIVGIVNDAVLNSPRFIFLIHFKSKDFDTINSTFESFAALRIRNY